MAPPFVQQADFEDREPLDVHHQLEAVVVEVARDLCCWEPSPRPVAREDHEEGLGIREDHAGGEREMVDHVAPDQKSVGAVQEVPSILEVGGL